jgi:hypothetical protein
VEDDETAGCMEQDDGRNGPAAGAVFLEVHTAAGAGGVHGGRGVRRVKLFV